VVEVKRRRSSRLAPRGIAPRLVALLALHVATAGRAGAQELAPGAWNTRVDGAASPSRASWLESWSPLRGIADLGRPPHRAPAPRGIDVPAPAVGAFLLAGAPGAINRDLSRGDSLRWGVVELTQTTEHGEFRRPFDAGRSTLQQVTGIGWQPVGARGMAIGSFVVDQSRLDQSAFTSRVTPYSASPFVLADSVTPAMERAHARLEGALGLRLGEWGAGLSAGVDARQDNSVESPIRRTARQAIPAATIGLERTLFAGVRLGLFGRWTEQVETQQLNPSPGATTYYAVQGIDRPVPYVLSGSALLTRIERRATAYGATVSGQVWGIDATAAWERGQRAEDQFSAAFQATRPTDRWRPSGQAARVGLQGKFSHRGQWQVIGSYDALSGDAVRADLTGLAMQVDEHRTAGEVVLRWMGDRAGFLGFGGLTQHSRTLLDFVAQSTARTERATPFVGGEAVVRPRGWRIAVGTSAAIASGSGSIPPLASQAPSYTRLVAPALSYELASVTAWSAWARAGRRVGRTMIDVTARVEQATPSAIDVARAQPAGTRQRFTLGVGARP
jgi:hypothetical protein